MVIFFFTIYSCSEFKGDKESLNYDRIEIKFIGYSEAYETAERLNLLISDLEIVKKLNSLKNNSKPAWFGSKGSDYIINLIFYNSKNNEKLLVRILKGKYSEPIIEYGTGTMFDNSYKNEEFVEYVSNLIKLEKIKHNNGTLTQQQYDEMLLKED